VALYVDQREESQGDGTGMWDLDHHINRAFMECTHCSRPKIRLNVLTYPTDGETNLSIPSEPARHVPVWINDLPTQFREVLLEVHEAFSERHYWLVSAGVKTLIDMFATDRIGTIGDFDAKLSRLHKERFLSDAETLLLREAADLSNGVITRLQKPTERECLALLDVVEHLVQKLTFGKHAETLSRIVLLKVKS
jgi:hypothetical protein